MPVSRKALNRNVDTHLFRIYANNLVCYLLHEANTFLENAFSPAFATEKARVHFVQGNVLEAEQAGGVMVRDDNTIHISNADLEAVGVLKS